MSAAAAPTTWGGEFLSMESQLGGNEYGEDCLLREWIMASCIDIHAWSSVVGLEMFRHGWTERETEESREDAQRPRRTPL
jgi:hypothetical protein